MERWLVRGDSASFLGFHRVGQRKEFWALDRRVYIAVFTSSARACAKTLILERHAVVHVLSCVQVWPRDHQDLACSMFF